MQERIDELEEERGNLMEQLKDQPLSVSHGGGDEASLRIEAQSTKIQTLL